MNLFNSFSSQMSERIYGVYFRRLESFHQDKSIF